MVVVGTPEVDTRVRLKRGCVWILEAKQLIVIKREIEHEEILSRAVGVCFAVTREQS